MTMGSNKCQHCEKLVPTRAMCKQLLLQSEPKGACQQQGLHFIYAQTCREKRCSDCMLGGQGI